MRIVPGTQELFERFYGYKPAFRSRTYFVFLDDDKLVAMFGFVHIGRDRKFIYVNMKDELQNEKDRKKIIARGSRFGVKLADENGWTLVAQAAEGAVTADSYLRHYGFEIDDDGMYVRWANTHHT